MIKVACATDEGKNFIKRHFGDANSYVIFNVDKSKCEYIETIDNETLQFEENDDGHGDPPETDDHAYQASGTYGYPINKGQRLDIDTDKRKE